MARQRGSQRLTTGQAKLSELAVRKPEVRVCQQIGLVIRGRDQFRR